MGRVTVTLTGDEARILRSLDKVIAKERELARAAEDTTRKSKKGTEEAGQSADSMSKKIGTVAASWLTVNTAMNLTKSLLDSMVKSWKRNTAAAEQTLDAALRFQALRTGNADPADRTLVLGNKGLLSNQQGFDLGFSARSAGFGDDDVKALLRQASANSVGAGGSQMGKAVGEAIVTLKQSSFPDHSIRQISSFLTAAAAESPLDAAQFGPQFTKIAGVAGVDAESKAIAAALLSAQIRAGETPDRASTAIRGFLAKRDTKNPRALLERIGAGGHTADNQIYALSQALEFGEITQPELISAFGQETASPLTSLLRSSPALGGIDNDVSAMLAALDSSGPSLAEQELAGLAKSDPKTAAMLRKRLAEREGEAADALRGYEQAPLEADLEEIKQGLRRRSVTGNEWEPGLRRGVQKLLPGGEILPFLEDLPEVGGGEEDLRELLGGQPRDTGMRDLLEETKRVGDNLETRNQDPISVGSGDDDRG